MKHSSFFIDRYWCLSKTFHALVNLGRKEGATCTTLIGSWILDISKDCSKGPYQKQGCMKGNILHIPMPNLLIKQIWSQ